MKAWFPRGVGRNLTKRLVAALASALALACAVAATAQADFPYRPAGGNAADFSTYHVNQGTVPNDVAYKREMIFRAVPMSSLLTGVGADETLRFVASDGFVATLSAAPR